MTTPKLCPICCDDSLERLLRETWIPPQFPSSTYSSSAALAYHCAAGHVFWVVSDRFKCEEPIRQGDGYSMMV
jgi:hypothetical protein